MHSGGTGGVHLGYQAGKGGSGTNTNYNVFVGYKSGLSINNGDTNTGVGYESLYTINDGISNIGIGNRAGYNITDGNNNICIGSGSVGEATMSDQLRIGNSNHLTTISASLVTGETIVRSQRPFQTISTNPFTASADNVGNYFRMGGNVTCSIKVNATASCPVGAEFDFFQTSSALNVLFEADPGVTINSKNDNLNLSGQFSSVTIKKVGTDEWDLMGDLT